MLNKVMDDMIFQKDETLMIPAENVAHVLDQHSLIHAMLVLTQVGYSRIPVLNEQGRFVGTVALANIVRTMFENEDIDARQLGSACVRDVMDTHNIVTYLPLNHEEILHKLVNANFLPVLDQDDYFKGIIPRQKVLTGVNYLAHDIDKHYVIQSKEEE